MTKMATMYQFSMCVANKKQNKNEADGNTVWIIWAIKRAIGAKKNRL